MLFLVMAAAARLPPEPVPGPSLLDVWLECLMRTNLQSEIAHSEK